MIWPAFAAEDGASPGEPVIYLPTAEDSATRELAFDLAGSDIPKLQLELGGPLRLHAASEARRDAIAGGSVLAATALEFTAGNALSMDATVSARRDQRPFMALGSIHCENGTLSAVSYRASHCYFVDDRTSATSGVLALGARYRVTDQASARLSVFRAETAYSALTTRLGASPFPSAFVDAGFAGGLLSGIPFASLGPIQRMQRLDSEMTGIDLEFQVGISTDRAGDMVLGLHLTRVLDSGAEGAWVDSPAAFDWTIAEPFDTARLSFDWQRGAFSGGIESYYRTPIEFLDRAAAMDSVTTFDVHFTWRAPWNASLSVGASNVLNAGVEDGPRNDNQLTDPFESVYGRIPYVRYKQDL